MLQIAIPFNRLLSSNTLAAAAIGVGTVLTADHAAAYYEYRHQDDHAESIVFDNDADTTIYTLPGCRTNVRSIAPMLEPAFSKSANTAYIAYSNRGFDLKNVGQAMLDARARIANRGETSVYGHSMGGLVLASLFENSDFREAFGSVDRLVLDSSPSDIHDVRAVPRMWLELASRARFSKSLGMVSCRIMSRQAQQHARHHAPGVDDEQVASHYRASAATPLYTVASQGGMIKHGRAEGLALATAGGQAYYVESPGNQDDVVRTERAYNRYNDIMHGTLQRVIDQDRPLGSRACGPEYPQRIARLLGATVV